VTSRAAYAFATHGDTENAETHWRQTILVASEDGMYGDALAAMRASHRVAWDAGRGTIAEGLAESALPNDHRLLAGTHDPALSALEAAHNDRLPDAFGDTRRYLWESRLSGQWLEELLALGLFGDVLPAGHRPKEAVQTYVLAGDGRKAAELASSLPEPINIGPWIRSPVRRRRAAAAQVVGAQVHAYPDDDVAPVVGMLLDVAGNLWQSRWISPQPEVDALNAIASFGVRIPQSAVDRILAIAEPALGPRQSQAKRSRTCLFRHTGPLSHADRTWPMPWLEC
jgi:hypothetical protein